jgi:hypothetical protein
MDGTLINLASRIKARTRDLDVLELCDAVLQGRNQSVTSDCNQRNHPKRDRAAYMRDYRKRRARCDDM